MGEKLIRNGYAATIEQDQLRVASPEELDRLLLDKHKEEVDEFLDAIDRGRTEEISEEAGDVIEAVLATTSLHNIGLPQSVEISRAITDEDELRLNLMINLKFLNQAINNGIEGDILLAGFSTIETVFNYADSKGATKEMVTTAMLLKRQDKGDFSEGIVLIEAD